NLIQPMRSCLKHALNKCSVTIETFVKLLSAYSTVSPSEKINIFGDVMLEELKTTLRGSRIRMNRDTLIIILQLVLWDLQPSVRPLFRSIEEKIYDSSTTSPSIKKNKRNNPISSTFSQQERLPSTTRPSYFINVSDNLFDDFVSFLENPPITKQYSKKEFKVGVCLSQLVVSMCNQKYDLLKKIFLSPKPTDSRRTIRLLNWILLGISTTTDTSTELITSSFDFQDEIMDLLSDSLKHPFNEVVAGDLNYLYTPSGELAYLSFILVKIWTILYDHKITERRFWNSIWPSIKKQLFGSIVERDVQPNGIAYWEMFMDLITFLHLNGSDIVWLYSQEWCTILDSLIHEEESTIPTNSSMEFLHKVQKARSMFDNPPLKVQNDMLIAQLYLEMREAMRIYCEISSSGVESFNERRL
ncbi:8483_t:CDS:2, partial [Diversispora eburnea]